MIRECEQHGYFTANECPDCGNSGKEILNKNRRKRLSKFMSGCLRHFPHDAGLSMDEKGWVSYDELVSVVVEKYPWVDPEHIEAVIETDPKGRFERDDRRVRASYGHSVDVDLEKEETVVPDKLYHGTDPENLDSIMEEGLLPMERQEVHLSETIDDALTVGSRHTHEPVVLEVDARGMSEDGWDIVKRGRETYTTDVVPPRYISILRDDKGRFA
ncbi:MAG: RNA 2'-phosphotransferase [Halobacteria archaeon]|nr:RNA 2'-phosphotransferase [Halobacteria archaeon]